MSFSLTCSTGIVQGGQPVAACGFPATLVVTPSTTVNDVITLSSNPPGLFAQNPLVFSNSSTAQQVGFTPITGGQVLIVATAASGATITGSPLLLLVSGSLLPGQTPILGTSPGLPSPGASGTLPGAITFATGLTGQGVVQLTATALPTANHVFAEFSTVTSGTGAILPSVGYPALIKVVNDGASARVGLSADGWHRQRRVSQRGLFARVRHPGRILAGRREHLERDDLILDPRARMPISHHMRA